MGKLSRIPSRAGWLVVLVATLTVSGWSLFWVARRWGVPPLVAGCLSACFDGVALLAAGYSLDAIRDGHTDRWPRGVTFAFAAASAYVNSLHATLSHELPSARLAWAVPPLGAVIAYDLHNRRERAKARARYGAQFPAPMPSFDIWAWVLFPVQTLTVVREIVMRRVTALAANTPAKPSKPMPKPQTTVSPPANPAEPNAVTNPAEPEPNVISMTGRAKPSEVRAWAKRNGYDIGDRARIPGHIWEAHRSAPTARS